MNSILFFMAEPLALTWPKGPGFLCSNKVLSGGMGLKRERISYQD
jgi:hypothetical protein